MYRPGYDSAPMQVGAPYLSALDDLSKFAIRLIGGPDRGSTLRMFTPFHRQQWRRRALPILPLIACIALSGCASRMLYYPSKNVYATPASSGLTYESVQFASHDHARGLTSGTQLSGWFIPAIGTPKGTVIHFHGNAQNMTAHFSYVSWLPREGYNVFVFDYRGYGASEGKPSREGLHRDSLAALKYVRSRPDIDPERLLILGQSLGGALALAAMADGNANGIKGIAIDSTFYSYRLIARDVMKQIPVLSLTRWPLSFLVISNRRSPCSVIGKLAPIPLLFLHGTDDAVIPYRHGRLLFDAAREPKEFISVEGGRHTDAFVHPDSSYRRQLLRFFEKANLSVPPRDGM